MPKEALHEAFDIFMDDLLSSLERGVAPRDTIQMMLETHEPGLASLAPWDGSDAWWTFLGAFFARRCACNLLIYLL